MFDWQVILVICALVLACIYVGRRGWMRLSSLALSRRMNVPSCVQGCGGCGAKQPSKGGGQTVQILSRATSRSAVQSDTGAMGRVKN